MLFHLSANGRIFTRKARTLEQVKSVVRKYNGAKGTITLVRADNDGQVIEQEKPIYAGVRNSAEYKRCLGEITSHRVDIGYELARCRVAYHVSPLAESKKYLPKAIYRLVNNQSLTAEELAFCMATFPAE